MLPFKLTEEKLKLYRACENGIKFVKRNNMLGKTLVRAEGNYEGYIKWFKTLPEIVVDINGNVVREMYPDGETITYTYDEKGNKLSLTSSYGDTKTYTYDENGNILSETDIKGRIIAMNYDENANIIKITYPDKSWTNFT